MTFHDHALSGLFAPLAAAAHAEYDAMLVAVEREFRVKAREDLLRLGGPR